MLFDFLMMYIIIANLINDKIYKKYLNFIKIIVLIYGRDSEIIFLINILHPPVIELLIIAIDNEKL